MNTMCSSRMARLLTARETWVSGDIALQWRSHRCNRKSSTAFTRSACVDAKGLVVSPGFIDILGQSEASLLIDNRSLSKLAQGITTESTGEGGSIAPQTEITLNRCNRCSTITNCKWIGPL